MIGLVDRERVDEELYDDYETVKAREVCLFYCKVLVSFVMFNWLLNYDNSMVKGSLISMNC